VRKDLVYFILLGQCYSSCSFNLAVQLVKSSVTCVSSFIFGGAFTMVFLLVHNFSCHLIFILFSFSVITVLMFSVMLLRTSHFELNFKIYITQFFSF